MPTLLNDGEIHGWTKTVIGEWLMKDSTAAVSLSLPAGRRRLFGGAPPVRRREM